MLFRSVKDEIEEERLPDGIETWRRIPHRFTRHFEEKALERDLRAFEVARRFRRVLSLPIPYEIRGSNETRRLSQRVTSA